MNNLEKKISRLIIGEKYNKPNGEINKSKLAKDLKITRKTLLKYMNNIQNKSKKSE